MVARCWMWHAVAVGVAMAALAAGSLPAYTQASEPALDLAGGSAADRTVTVTLQRASLDAGLRIENRSDKRLQVRIVATALRGTDGQTVATTWERRANGAAVEVSGEPFELDPHQPIELAVRAALVRVDTYAAEVSLFVAEPTGGQERRERTIALTVDRQVPTLDDLITTPAPLLIDKRIPLVGQDIALRLPLRNTTTVPRELRAPVLTEVVRKFNADQSYAVELRGVATEASCGGSDGKISISPDGVCAVTFTIPGIRQAGAYTATVAVAGSDGGKKESQLQFVVRLHWAWAGLTVLAGILAGGLITTWQTRGREQYLRLEDTAELVTRLEALQARAAPLGVASVVDVTLADTHGLRARILAGRDGDPVAELSALRGRASALANWLDIEMRCRELDAVDVTALQEKLNAVRNVLGDGAQPFNKDEVDRQLKELRDELPLAQRRTGLRRRYLTMARSSALLPFLREVNDPALAEAAKNADETLKRVGTLLASSGTNLASAPAIEDAEAAFRTGVEGLVNAAATYLRMLTSSGRRPWFEPTVWQAVLDDLSARASQIRVGGDAPEVQGRIESALLAYVRADAAALRSGAAAQRSAETDATKKADWEALAAALDGLEVLEEPARLPEALRLLRAQERRYIELAAIPEAEAAGLPIGAEAAPELSGVGFDWPVPWFVGKTDPPETISRRRQWLDWVVNIALAVVLALVGVQTLWVPNASWGSVGDVLTAFIAGAAVYSGIGAMVQQVRQR